MRNLYLLFLAVVASAFVSCRQAELEPEQGRGTPISFSAERFAVDISTKAYSENTVSQVRTNGFKVAGVVQASSSKPVMFNCHATYSSTNSKFTPDGGPFYYPISDAMNFYAVYPSSHVVSIAANGAATISYSQSNTEINNDLLATKALNVVSQSTPVALTFDHIKTLLHFKAIGMDEHAQYRLTGITVNAPNGGTYDYASDSWIASSTNADYVYTGSTTILSGTTTIAGGMTLVPCSPTITVTWDCYTLDGVTKVATYSVTKELNYNLVKGKDVTVTLSLPNSDAVPIEFTVTVNSWTSDTFAITMENTPPPTIAGLQLAPGPLYYDGTDYHIADNWYVSPTQHTYGKMAGSFCFSYFDMCELFGDNRTFTYDDFTIQNNLDPFDGYRLPTSDEIHAIIGYAYSSYQDPKLMDSSELQSYKDYYCSVFDLDPSIEIFRPGSTVNGNDNIHVCPIFVNERDGWLLFPDNQVIIGCELHDLDPYFNSGNNNPYADDYSFNTLSQEQLNEYINQGCYVILKLPVYDSEYNYYYDSVPGFVSDFHSENFNGISTYSIGGFGFDYDSQYVLTCSKTNTYIKVSTNTPGYGGVILVKSVN